MSNQPSWQVHQQIPEGSRAYHQETRFTQDSFPLTDEYPSVEAHLETEAFPKNQRNAQRATEAVLAIIRQNYILQNSDELILILSDLPILSWLLIEGVSYLRQAFGEHYFLQLDIEESDDGSVVRALISLPANFENADDRLRVFDESWWLNNMHRSRASLVFDYELRDGN